MDSKKYPDCLLFNMDETMLSANPNHPEKVLVLHRSRAPAVEKPMASDHITIAHCVSASGEYLSPLLILKLKSMPDLPKTVHDNACLVF